MPEIAYTITAELTVDTIRQWAELDIYPDAFTRSPAEIGKIKACRQWVAENPERPKYPDGTIAEAVIETVDGESRRVIERFDGKWFYAPKKEVQVILWITSLRVLHTPPTMRDHLHEVGLTDEMITEIPDQWRHFLPGSPLGVIADACREAAQ